MRYFVMGGDGRSYGPADIETIRAWIQQGRVNADTELRDESGAAVRAGDLEALQDALNASRPAPSWAYPYPPCRNCGQPFDLAASRVCPNCGAAQPSLPEGRLLTGSDVGDKVLGFIVGFFSYMVYGIGAIVGLVLYFAIRQSHPAFARGVISGLATVLVILLGLFAVCFIGLSSMH